MANDCGASLLSDRADGAGAFDMVAVASNRLWSSSSSLNNVAVHHCSAKRRCCGGSGGVGECAHSSVIVMIAGTDFGIYRFSINRFSRSHSRCSTHGGVRLA